MKSSDGRQEMRKFRKPIEIQHFLSSLKYREQGGAFSPAVVERTGAANCFDGAVYAAAALETLGHPPLIVDLQAEDDDDHVIAVYRAEGWGALAKSNTTMLRSREPVYRSLRELVMSYFDGYFNINGCKSLRSYSAPVDLRRFDALSWRTTEEPLDPIERCLAKTRRYRVLTGRMKRGLAPAEPLVMRACFLDSNPRGLYQPRKSKP